MSPVYQAPGHATPRFEPHQGEHSLGPRTRSEAYQSAAPGSNEARLVATTMGLSRESSRSILDVLLERRPMVGEHTGE